MQVHLVPVKVRIVRRTHGRVEPEGLVREDTNPMGHYRHSVKARLAVEQDNVAIPEMPLHDKAWLHSLRHYLPVCDEL